MQSATQNISYKGKLATRMAWTFGRARSPVLCTVLGDEPLFTIADRPAEEDLLDDILLALELDEALDAQARGLHNLPEMKRRLAELEKLERAAAHLESYKPISSEQRFAAVCDTSRNTVFMMEQALADSHTLHTLYQTIARAGVTVETSQSVAAAVYQKSSRTVMYNPDGARLSVLTGLIRAFRHADLDTRGGFLDPLAFYPEDAVVLNRLYVADSAALTMQIAWEMNLKGVDALWVSILGSSGYDLAIAYARAAVVNFRNIDNGTAAQAVVEAWFFSGRCRELDQALIRDFLSRNSDPHMLGQGQLLSLGRKLLGVIGERCQGQNYLTPMIEMVLTDPLFTDVRDRSSANFLWFLKFEREFQHQEQKMAATPVVEELGQIVAFPKMSALVDVHSDKGLKP